MAALNSDVTLASAAKSFVAMTVTDSAALSALEPEAAKILANQPNHVPALMVNAAVQARSGDLVAAERSLGEVLRRFPEFAPAQKHLAALLVERPGKLDEALNLATKARKTLGDDRELLEIFAGINFKKKNFSNVIGLLRIPAVGGGLSARSLFYLGISYKEESNVSESQRILQQALDAGLAEPHAGEATRALEEMGE